MKGMLNYLFIIILIGFISSCSTKRDKPIQEGNSGERVTLFVFCGYNRVNPFGNYGKKFDRGS